MTFTGLMTNHMHTHTWDTCVNWVWYDKSSAPISCSVLYIQLHEDKCDRGAKEVTLLRKNLHLPVELWTQCKHSHMLRAGHRKQLPTNRNTAETRRTNDRAESECAANETEECSPLYTITPAQHGEMQHVTHTCAMLLWDNNNLEKTPRPLKAHGMFRRQIHAEPKTHTVLWPPRDRLFSLFMSVTMIKA